MLGIMDNGVYAPTSNSTPSNVLTCPWCGAMVGLHKRCNCVAYVGVGIDEAHLAKIEDIHQMLRASMYNPIKFNVYGNTKSKRKIYSDIVIPHTTPGYRYSITLVNTEADLEDFKSRTFELSMMSMFVGYIFDYEHIDLANSRLVEFVNEYFGYVTVLYNHRLYNYYPSSVSESGKLVEVKKVDLTSTTSKKFKERAYYKIAQITEKACTR